MCWEQVSTLMFWNQDLYVSIGGVILEQGGGFPLGSFPHDTNTAVTRSLVSHVQWPPQPGSPNITTITTNTVHP